MLGRKPVRRLLGLVLATSLALPAVARSAPAGPHLLGIRPLGMGNAFVAVCDDRNALHYNPAGLANIERWSISGLGMYGGVDDEFFEVVHFIEDNQEKFSDVDSIDQEFVDSLAPYDDRWVATDANAYIDFTRHNLGVGAYTSGRLQFKIDRGVYEPRVSFSVSDDIVGIAGVGYDLDRYDLRAGGSLKAIWRRGTERNLSAREVADFDPAEVLDDLAGSEGGFAVDLGTYWRGENPSSRPRQCCETWVSWTEKDWPPKCISARPIRCSRARRSFAAFWWLRISPTCSPKMKHLATRSISEARSTPGSFPFGRASTRAIRRWALR